jgi:putative transposase
MPRRKEPRIPDAILDQLLAGADARTAFDPNGLLDDLKKALAERVLNAEMDHHLAGEEPGNRRNGYGRKTVVTDTGQIELEVPRDRQASFDPQLIAKYQRRFPGFDDKIISMYARGMSTREIVGHLRDLYGIAVSPDLISSVTDAVLEEVAAWQARPLEATYPLVFFDALRVKIRDEGLVRNKAVHIALGVRADGAKEILGLWLEQNEGAKFWLRVMNELKNRGVEDVLIAVVDGLKGFPDAITAVFPQATVQTCIVHLLRHSLDFVSWKDRKPVAGRHDRGVHHALLAIESSRTPAYKPRFLSPPLHHPPTNPPRTQPPRHIKTANRPKSVTHSPPAGRPKFIASPANFRALSVQHPSPRTPAFFSSTTRSVIGVC